MADEKHHRVLSDEVYPRYSGQVYRNQQSRQATQNGSRVENRDEGVTRKLVTRHRIGAIMENNIAGDKGQNKGKREPGCRFSLPHSKQSAPHTSEFEKENSHEDVAQPQPQGILQCEKPVADNGKQKVETGTPLLYHRRGLPEQAVAPLFQKMDSNVGRKETD